MMADRSQRCRQSAASHLLAWEISLMYALCCPIVNLKSLGSAPWLYGSLFSRRCSSGLWRFL